MAHRSSTPQPPSPNIRREKLEIVVKSDVAGTAEAVRSALTAMKVPDVDLRVIHSGIGPVSKSDVLMAKTGSRLIIGFNVDVQGQIEPHIREQGVEVRLYETIFRLSADVQVVAAGLHRPEPEETITGQARIIELFKSSHKGIIIGCQVTAGKIEKGKNFRVIAAMGPSYTGRIESLHLAEREVTEGRVGQQVGIKIAGWKKAKIGDIVECFDPPRPGGARRWQPKSGVFRIPAAG
jgi:translation initiation factor IF-2